MELIQHTINWTKGEILEATIMGVVGLLIVLSAFLFWKFGASPNARAMVIPILVVGLIPVATGISGVITNKNRIPAFEQAWEQDSQQFILDEKERVEGFDQIFKYSYPAAIILVMAGAILFFLLGSANWKAISLAMMLLGLMAYFIDHFAAERADHYLEQIMRELG